MKKLLLIALIGIIALVGCDLFVTTGTISFISDPEGAEIYLDGADVYNVTNLVYGGVDVGEHEVKLRLTGYEDYDTTITVEKNDTVIVDAKLVPKVN